MSSKRLQLSLTGKIAWAVIITSATAVVLLAFITIYLWKFRPASRPTEQQWEHDNIERILALKGEAESLAIAGKLPEAHSKYRELEILVVGHSIKDPHLSAITEHALADKDRIYAIVLGDMANRLTPAMYVLDTPAATQPAAAPVSASTPFPQATANSQAVTPASSLPTITLSTFSHPTTAPFIYPITARAISDHQLTDLHVLIAMQRAIGFLTSQFKDGELNAGRSGNPVEYYSRNALCVYALAQAGIATRDSRIDVQGEFMQRALDKLKSERIETNAQFPAGPVVYARSLRGAALATYHRREDLAALSDDIEWLIKAAADGAYTNDAPDSGNRQAVMFAPSVEASVAQVRPSRPPPPRSQQSIGVPGGIPRTNYIDLCTPPRSLLGQSPPLSPPFGSLSPGRYLSPQFNYGRPMGASPDLPNSPRPQSGSGQSWDNLNSFFAVLAVDAAAEAGAENVPDQYWNSVARHWEACQLADGQWPFAPYEMTPSHQLNCGGVASLLAASRWLDKSTPSPVTVASDPLVASITNGIAWLDHGDNSINVLGPKTDYVAANLFCLQRAALASGLKKFGSHDWYRDLALSVIASQAADGSFALYSRETDNIVSSAFALLFLARGYQPILMNKLKMDASWARGSHEVANLAAFASHELERPIGWQLVSLQSEPKEWLDSPLLFISSQQPLKFTDAEISKLRTYALSGGTIFTHADHSSTTFNQSVIALSHRLFPDYPLIDLPADHELYKTQYKMALPHPRLQAVSNGSRLLLVHSPTDLSSAWHAKQEKTRREAFELPINLYLYCAGQVDLRHRLDTPAYPQPNFPPAAKLAVVRVSYSGNWNPEPLAWDRFATYLQWRTGLTTTTSIVELALLDNQHCPIAHLTGTAAYIPSDSEITALSKFVDHGGLLLVDACGGSPAFAGSFETAWLPHIFADADLKPVPPDHLLLKPTIDGMEDVSTPHFRPSTLSKIGKPGKLKILPHGKGLIVYSPYDLTTGLTGSNTVGGLGYESMYVEDLVKNAVLWAYGRNTLGDGQ